MARYAASTDVTVERSQAEIRVILKRYGATGFAFAEDDTAGTAMIVFRMADRHYRLYVPMPDRRSSEFLSAGNNRGTFLPARYEQACRQRWRAAALYVKAVLEAAESGIVSLETALLAHLLLPNGQTVGQATAGPIDESYRTGRMPELLPGLSGRMLPPGSAA